MILQSGDFNPREPIYLQIVEKFRRAIARGELRPGEKVAGVRDLAGHLLVNPNTVQRAYQELERERLFVTRRGLGTFVSDSPHLAGPLRTRLAESATDWFLAEMRALGYSEQEAEAYLARTRRVKTSKGGGAG